MKYKGHIISQNTKKKWFKDKVSGHKWSKDMPLSTFSILGPFLLSNIHNEYRSIERAKEYIDFRIRWKLNFPPE